MASKNLLLSRILATSVSLADKSSEIARDVFHSGDLKIIEKEGGINDLQTTADRKIQGCIVSSLRKKFPSLPIIGEEGEEHVTGFGDNEISLDEDAKALEYDIPKKFHDISIDNLVVWVDPLDGTKEFTQGFVDHVTILIGIALGDDVIAGVINQPFHQKSDDDLKKGRTVYGVVGSQNEPILAGGLKPNFQPEKSCKFPTIVTSRSHGSSLIDQVIEKCNPYEVKKVGGAGYKVLMLLEGEAHVYLFPSAGCKKWDTCAPEALLKAVGGRLTDCNGNVYKYGKDVEFLNKFGVLATCEGVDHQKFLDCIPKKEKN